MKKGSTLYQRVPFAPLAEYMRLTGVGADGQSKPGSPDIALGISHETFRKWRSRGLSMWQADQAAVQLGVHPALIWPEYHDWEPRLTRDDSADIDDMREVAV